MAALAELPAFSNDLVIPVRGPVGVGGPLPLLPYTGRYLHYEAFHLTTDGHRHVDERGNSAAIERIQALATRLEEFGEIAKDLRARIDGPIQDAEDGA